jgi:dUTP pyrophosphatase
MDYTGDGGSIVQLDIWRQQAKHRLTRADIMVYDPAAAWAGTIGTVMERRIEMINGVALGRADLLFALLPPGIRSIGVPMEIERAMLNSIPCFIAGGKGSQALARYTNWQGFYWSPEGDIDELVRQAEVATHGTQGKVPRRPEILAVTGEGMLPGRTYEGDAGFDLYVEGHWYIGPGESMDVPMGIQVELPPNTWGLLIGRSSTKRKLNLNVLPAVIDGGYRGDLFVYVTNGQDEGVNLEPGQRIAQLIPISLRASMMRPERVTELRPSDRGTDGFGSTGD